MRISEPSFTDSGIDATGKTENQTCTRVDGRSAPSTLSLPKSASAGGLGHGFPWARYYDLAHGNPISDTDTEDGELRSGRGDEGCNADGKSVRQKPCGACEQQVTGSVAMMCYSNTCNTARLGGAAWPLRLLRLGFLRI